MRSAEPSRFISVVFGIADVIRVNDDHWPLFSVRHDSVNLVCVPRPVDQSLWAHCESAALDNWLQHVQHCRLKELACGLAQCPCWISWHGREPSLCYR